MRVEPVSAPVERAALDFLSRKPYDYVFVSYLLRHDFSAATRGRIYVLRDGLHVRGAAYYGRQIALACEPDVAHFFAEQARKHRGDRMLLGPRATIDAYWPVVEGWHVAPRAVRDRQLVMVIDRARLAPYQPTVTVRTGRIDEWTAIADNAALMIAGELEYDPRKRAPDYAPNVRHMIEQKLWWVGESHGRLVFFCNVGPWCPKTAQLQGIWTPPEYRGQGLATAALAAICDRLLETSPTLSLYVNDFNEAAIALYRRIGFETVSEYKTVLF